MATFEAADIELFPNDKGEDFTTMDEFGYEGVDLYNDVDPTNDDRRDSGGSDQAGAGITSPTNSLSSISKSSTGNGDSQPLREHHNHDQHQVLVGNLTWWTTDEDIIECLHDIGVHDFLDVKFYEHKSNGQSKGYSMLTVGSDASLKLIKENMSRKKIHGQCPVVTPPSKNALVMFESQCKARPSQQTGQHSGGGGVRRGPGPMNQMGEHQMDVGMMGGYGSGHGHGLLGPPPSRMGGPPGFMNRGPRPIQMGGPPPGQHRQMFDGPPNQQRQQYMPRHMGPHYPQQQQQQEVIISRSPRGMDPYFPNQGHQLQQPPNGMPPPGPRMMTSHFRGPPRPRANWQPRQGQLSMQSRPPPSETPVPHMNPAYFHGEVPQHHPYITVNNKIVNSPNRMGVIPPVISEIEFEDMMGRNKAVSSLAISRAVSEAANGEYASAIETLVTAISLIKQSKVGKDDRCKILTSALQDTLRGVEDKSYGSKVPSSRDRSKSREKEKERRRRSSRGDRSRSREREREYGERIWRIWRYGDRERERERYYEYPRERERERSRSRERGVYIRRHASPVERTSSGRYHDESSRYRDRVIVERERVQDHRSREHEPERESVHR